MEMKPYRVHFSSNGLGDSEWDMKILKVIWGVGDLNCCKS